MEIQFKGKIHSKPIIYFAKDFSITLVFTLVNAAFTLTCAFKRVLYLERLKALKGIPRAKGQIEENRREMRSKG